MHGKFLLVLFVAMVVFAALSPNARAQPTGDDAYVITVLSPDNGPLREVGNDHRESVETAFGLKNADQTLTIRNHTVRFDFLGTGDPVNDTTATTCIEQAKRALKDSTIAILGPVASGCTERVLALSRESQVPVISSLSTATDLGGQSRSFFRTIAHDRKRLEAFVDTARARKIAVDTSIVIYRDSDYGHGLFMHLKDLVDGLDSRHTFLWHDAFEETDHGFTLSESIKHAVQHHDHPIKNVFVLGSSDRMVPIIWALHDMFAESGGRPSFVLVGSMPNTNDLPEDTWLIGEAQVSTSRNLIKRITKMDPPDNLYVSTFDASLALRHAIENVLELSQSAPLPVQLLRRKLRDELESGEFPSSERGRRVEFSNGEIIKAPTTPFYRVSLVRDVENINAEPPISWVEMRLIEAPNGHLEGPVVVELIPHGEEMLGKEVVLQVDGIGEETETVQKVTLTHRSGTRVSFVPSFWGWHWKNWFPSRLTITTNKTNEEHIEISSLGWPVSYLVAALTALVGALLYLRYKPQREKKAKTETAKPRKTWSYVDRCLAGVVIAFLIIHIGPLLEADPYLSHIPIPEFGSSWWVNAVVSGLMGGWLGLNPIVALVSSIIGALAPVFQSDS